MKKAIILLSALSFSVIVCKAQSQIEENFKLDRKMASLQEAIKNEPTTVQSQVDDLVKTFPFDWRSYYWSAYTTYKSAQAIEEEKTKIDKLKKAEGWLKRAESIGVENSEIELLKAFIDYEKIITNPEVLKAKYQTDLDFHLANFEKYNIESPRYYLLRGIMAINDTLDKPQNFDIAGDYFSGAQLLYEEEPKFKKNYADPFWGKERVDTYMLLFGNISKGPVEAGMEDVMQELEEDIENKREGADAEPKKEEAEETQEESIEAAKDEIDAAIEEIGEEDSKKSKKEKKKSKKEKKSKKDKK